MARTREYNDEVKAAALAALLEGQSINEVAERYSIPAGTLKSWKSRQENGLQPVAAVATDKREHIGELLLAYLQANLETLTAQLQVFKDAEWLKKQSGSEAAVLHGVLTDKAIRLLEAFGRNDEAEES